MVQRWTRVASAWLAGVVFAPVELLQVGGGYFVRDGHHRISVARAVGQLTIEAEVTIWEVASRPVRAEQPAQTKGPSTNCQPAFAF